MEYVRGPTLRTLLQEARKSDRQLPLPVLGAMAVSICRALEYAYTSAGPDMKPRCIVHRDVTSTNVLLAVLAFLDLSPFRRLGFFGLRCRRQRPRCRAERGPLCFRRLPRRRANSSAVAVGAPLLSIMMTRTLPSLGGVLIRRLPGR